jgi:hypothetical protein
VVLVNIFFHVLSMKLSILKKNLLLIGGHQTTNSSTFLHK